MSNQASIREEELKNRVATLYFGKYDCTRIVGNIDFCVLPKRRDPRQMMFIPDTPILWAEAKNHPTDVYRMLAQLILTIKGELKGDEEPPRFVGCFDNEKIAFVEYHYILPVFNLNDFNWTQTPSSVDDKTVETVRGVIPADKMVVFRFGADDAEIKAFIARNFTSGESPALATPIDRNNFTFIYQKWRNEVMPHIDAPWDVLKKKYALYATIRRSRGDRPTRSNCLRTRRTRVPARHLPSKTPNLPVAKATTRQDLASLKILSILSKQTLRPLPLCVKDHLSSAASAVLDAGRELWCYYHVQPNANPNATYYDIRLHFQGVKKTSSGKEQMNATSSDETYNALLTNLRAAHKALAARIAPKVYEYGFLKR